MARIKERTITRADLLAGLTKARLLQIANFVGLWDQEKSLRKDLYAKLLTSKLFDSNFLVDLLNPSEVQSLYKEYGLSAEGKSKEAKCEAVRNAVAQSKRGKRTKSLPKKSAGNATLNLEFLDILQVLTKDRLFVLAYKIGFDVKKSVKKEQLIRSIIHSVRSTSGDLLGLLTLDELRTITNRHNVQVVGRRKQNYISALEVGMQKNNAKKAIKPRGKLLSKTHKKNKKEDKKPIVHENSPDRETILNAGTFRWRHRPNCPFCECVLKDEYTFVAHVTGKCPGLYGRKGSKVSNAARKNALDILRSKIDFDVVKIAEIEGIRRARKKVRKKTARKRGKKIKRATNQNTTGMFGGRALPPRVTSMVSGGLPSLGKRR